MLVKGATGVSKSIEETGETQINVNYGREY